MSLDVAIARGSNTASVAYASQQAGKSPGPGADERHLPTAVMREVAEWAVQASWWPKGVGLHVDDGDVRHEFEPPGGVRCWINVRREPEREVKPYVQAWCCSRGRTIRSTGTCDQRRAFARALLEELKFELGGLSSKGALALPADVPALLQSLPSGPARPGNGGATWRKLPVPAPARFTAGESLTRHVALRPTSDDVAAVLSTVKGDVAARLGAALLERFDWRRPLALEMQPFAEMQRVLSAEVASPRAWSLKVGPCGRDVHLMLHDARGARSLGSVLKAGPHLEGAYIFRPRLADDLEAGWIQAAKRYNGEAARQGRFMVPTAAAARPGHAPLRGIDPSGRIIVLGHGLPLPVPGRQRYNAKVGGRCPEALAKDLLREGLPKDFRGTIYLDACNGGGGPGDTTSYAHRFQRALAKHGVRQATVAGLPGASRGEHHTLSTFPEHLASGTGRTVRASQARLQRLQRLHQAMTPAASVQTGLTALIADEQAHLERIRALNAPQPASVGGARHLPLAGKLRWAWTAIKTVLGLHHGHVDDWSLKNPTLEQRAWVRAPWGHIGPR